MDHNSKAGSFFFKLVKGKMNVNREEWLVTQVESWGGTLTDKQLEQFANYYDLLIEMNRVMNLTSITDYDEVYVKHFYDSLVLGKYFQMEKVKSIIDVGTGAGFPGIPLKIAYPHLRLVLLDSLKKRVNFLEDVVKKLELQDVRCVHGRAEEWGRKKGYRESFDLVTARAVAKLSVLAEYCLPFARVGGWMIAMKGADVAQEVSEAELALRKLGKESVQPISFSLPEGMGERHLLIIKKGKSTPSTYPRRPGIPAKQPID
jgi:16S rRNA (guanine527-N7)-methyltransferase